MRILIVSATAAENRFNVGYENGHNSPTAVMESTNHDIDVLVTGIGAVPTAFAITRYAQGYDLVINIGIAGSYRAEFSIGAVVCVKEDAFGDYGVDDGGNFKTFSDITLSAGAKSSHDEILVNPWLSNNYPGLNAPRVKGLTLSTASGSRDVIEKINQRWNADIETMESASVFYVCNRLGIRFVCFRAISNMVEPRDKSKWEIEKAISNLDIEVRSFIRSLP